MTTTWLKPASIAFLAALAFYLVTGRAEPAGKPTCEEQLGKLQAAVQKYRAAHPTAAGWSGKTPRSLQELVPGLLSKQPVCPVTGKPFHYRQAGESCWIWCSGHPGGPANFPRATVVGKPADNQKASPGAIFSTFAAAETGCYSNLKNCGTAMEMYSTDFSGLYPSAAEKLTPDYLINLPRCPLSLGAEDYQYSTAFNPDRYTIRCQSRHPGATTGYPRYTSEEGLERTRTQP